MVTLVGMWQNRLRFDRAKLSLVVYHDFFHSTLGAKLAQDKGKVFRLTHSKTEGCRSENGT
jgi:hypothetical protein